jgi:hypothetical protein
MREGGSEQPDVRTHRRRVDRGAGKQVLGESDAGAWRPHLSLTFDRDAPRLGCR